MNDQTVHTSKCYLCQSRNTNDFFTLPPIPTMDGVMSNSEEEALNAIRGQIVLRFCKDCGYIGNEGHDSAKISFADYDFSNAHSPIFARHTKEISERLIRTYDLHEKSIIDVGCGHGYFLKTICQMGNNKGIGIDPGFDFSSFEKNGLDLTYIRDYYSNKYAEVECDLLTCRHVLNVINDPIEFIKTIRGNLATQKDSLVYVDVPYANYTFGDKIIWNVVYEHRSWFSETSLKLLFELCGFRVQNMSTCWNGEYLGIEATPISGPKSTNKPDEEIIEELSIIVAEFAASFEIVKSSYSEKINQIRATSEKTIAWGAGARSVSFFNQFDLKRDVPYIVDVNLKRQGKFLPGSGQEIVAPEFITSFKPDLLIITNPTYAAEIIKHTRSLGIDPEFWVL